jgi:phosphoglycolate phosphatase
VTTTPPTPGPDAPTIRLAVLDMAGTTVVDGGAVVRAFGQAATAVGLPEVGPERANARRYVLDTMGQSKIIVFRALFGDEATAQRANTAFEAAYGRVIGDGGTEPVPGATEAVNRMRQAGIKVAFTTGFSRPTQDALLTALGWQTLADLALTPSEAVRGRPYPDMVLTALLRLGVDDVREVAVLGDTASDITSGLRAGARVVAGTLTGAHDEATLRGAGATHIVPTVTAFADLLLTP